jgi:hypothetical protein
MKRILMLMLLGTMLTSCAAVDPSANDLKSPCVANDDGSGKVPCIRRKPLENYIA